MAPFQPKKFSHLGDNLTHANNKNACYPVSISFNNTRSDSKGFSIFVDYFWDVPTITKFLFIGKYFKYYLITMFRMDKPSALFYDIIQFTHNQHCKLN